MSGMQEDYEICRDPIIYCHGKTLLRAYTLTLALLISNKLLNGKPTCYESRTCPHENSCTNMF